jgi:galactokinase
LRGVTIEMLQQCVSPQDDIIYKRCKYVVEETQRLLAGCEDLERGDIQSLGRKMFQTHEDLASEYEVSCRELDFLVSAVRGNPAVLGARMMGGGFGGCTINLVKENAIDELTQLIYDSYKMKMKLEMTPYVVEVEQGTQRINSNVYANV